MLAVVQQTQNKCVHCTSVSRLLARSIWCVLGLWGEFTRVGFWRGNKRIGFVYRLSSTLPPNLSHRNSALVVVAVRVGVVI